ncbi:MAG: hypothetical protein B6I31_00135 [Desulfobacteraceae bacterium 4572_19]|nr:MAG: hypothetical protein B6I31_00135 [Desulfobacteraceae bacterium 4572_19]
MIVPTQPTNSNENSQIMLEKAKLVVSFFVKKGEMTDLIDKIKNTFSLAVTKQNYFISENKKFLLYKEPIDISNDSQVVQLIIEDDKQGITAWQNIRAKLIGKLDELQESWFPKEHFFGYTLTYLATLNKKLPLKDLPLREWYPHVRSLDTESKVYNEPIIHDTITKGNADQGWIWLVDIPRGYYLQASMVYLVIAYPETISDVIKYVIQNGALNEQDMIAHKSYYLARQYTGSKNEELFGELELISQTLLSKVEKNELTPEHIKDIGKLKENTTKVSTHSIPYLNSLSSSLKQQSVKLQRLVDGNTIAEGILSEHQKNTNHFLEGLDILINKGQQSINVSNTVTNDLNTILNIKRNKNERDFQAVIAILGVAIGSIFALPELINSDVAKGLIELGYYISNEWVTYYIFNSYYPIPRYPLEYNSFLLALFIQLPLIILGATLIMRYFSITTMERWNVFVDEIRDNVNALINDQPTTSSDPSSEASNGQNLIPENITPPIVIPSPKLTPEITNVNVDLEEPIKQESAIGGKS